MEIKVSDLKKFSKLSSHIKKAGILPIYSCIKFGGGYIQKTSSEAFVKYKCEDANESLLVDEKILFDLVGVSTSQVITIIRESKIKTSISDGKVKGFMQVPELSLFNDITEIGDHRIDLSSNFVEAIGSAAKVCQPMGSTPDKYMYVMIGNNGVVGISQSHGYYRRIEEDVTMVLEKKTADYLSKAGIVAVSQTEGHYIFYTNEADLGFAKQMLGYGDFASKLRGDLGDITFTTSNSSIKAFNTLAITLVSPEIPDVTMTIDGKLDMYHKLKDISLSKKVEGLSPSEEFTYNPVIMNDVLSALYTEELDFYQNSNFFFIKERDKNGVALIGKLVKQ